MRFSCIARVTESSWTICAVHDAAGYGLVPGGELPIDTTFCAGVRATGEPVVFDSASASTIYCDHPSPKLYGFESYVSLPLYQSNGQFFGTLCALDPIPATPSNAATFATLKLFAALISNQLYAEARLQSETLLHKSAARQLRVTLVAQSEAEKALINLKVSEDRFRAAVAATGVMWTNDASGKMTGEQPGWSALTGQTQTEYVDYGWAQAVHPDDATATIAAWNEAVAKRHTFDFQHRVRRHDGAWRIFEVKAVPILAENGIVREWVGVHTDITERKQFEQELAIKEARLRLATDVVGLGIWTWNPNIDSVTWENSKIREIFGVSADAAPINAALFTAQFLHHDDVQVFEESMQSVLSFGEKLCFRGRIYRADNNALRWIELIGETYEISCGVYGVLGTVTDITDRKKGEQALESQADELKNADRHKSEFIATLAHELRNPLAPIRNGVQLLRLASGDPRTVSRIAEVMERQLGQVVYLIDDLLDVTRISRGQIELCRQLVDLKQIAAMAVETSLPLIEARKHDLIVDICNDPLPLVADSGRIAQVISNLLTNAAKYTPTNGKIFLSANREEESAVITVRDSGIGIPPEAIDHLFNMFSQIDRHRSQAQGGLGIGLALVRTLVELHGGSVRASSAGDGLGSTFVVRLPLAPALDAKAAA